MTIPANHGKKWSEADHRLLVDMVMSSWSVTKIAKTLKRTEKSIRAKMTMLHSFENTCGTCIIDNEVLGITSIVKFAKILGAEANTVAFKKGDLNIDIIKREIGVHELQFKYKIIVDSSNNTYAKFEGLIPLEEKNPLMKGVKIDILK